VEISVNIYRSEILSVSSCSSSTVETPKERQQEQRGDVNARIAQQQIQQPPVQANFKTESSKIVDIQG
jgi:hypothetical protein